MTTQRNQGSYAMNPAETTRQVILAFRDEFNFMSNFAACRVTLPAEQGLPRMRFASTENAYMAWKTLDMAMRQKMQKMTPAEAKAETRKPDFPLRPDYTDAARLAIMLELNRQKYSDKNPLLRDQLLQTGDALLIEGNTWGDDFFGFDLIKGHGHNHLGRILMKVRREIAEP